MSADANKSLRLPNKPEDAVEVEFLDDDALRAIRNSAQAVLAEVEASLKAEVKPAEKKLCDILWPKLKDTSLASVSPKLRLLPMERIGVPQGKSGAKLALGFFVDVNQEKGGRRDCNPSAPMVIKFRKRSKDKKGGGFTDKLADEYDRACVVHKFAANADGFVFPLEPTRCNLRDTRSYAVQWSPFRPNVELWKGPPEKYGVNDLSKLLKGTWKSTKKPDLVDAVREVFHLLENAHTHYNQHRSISTSVVRHYRGEYDKGKSYLRDEKKWREPWMRAWGTRDRRAKGIKLQDYQCFHFGLPWTNPFWVLEQLEQLPAQNLCCGVVHGDLHPRNVVFDYHNAPHIIDFGWAQDNRHIAQDFVLLECNLRFFDLRPNVPTRDLQRMAEQVGFDRGLDDGGIADKHCQGHLKAIKALRQIAKDRFTPTTKWDVEYVVPLFLMALGLLEFMDECENQLACQLTILSLANRIGRKLFGKH